MNRMLRIGLLGERLSHSHSPAIHRELAGGRYTYELFERAPHELEAFMKGHEWDALNVTIPYKQAVMPYLDVISDEAARIGAVNTVTRLADGRLHGDNTDYFGFSSTLRACGCAVAGKKALVLGNGGAAATAVAVLSDMGAHVVVLARSQDTVGGVIPELYDTVYERHADAAVVVNCTPVGMYPRLVGQTLIHPAMLPNLTAVFDMVYNPARTALLQEARDAGIPAYNGLLMLVAQAKAACERFTGESLPDSCIPPIVESISRQTENVILIGMPGSGKSTVGRLLANTMGRRFVDTDRLIVEMAGKSIPAIFAEDGEEVFRALEHEVVLRVGMESGQVIATGGGVVTRAENHAPLSQNGRLVFLHRDLDKLSREGRPLSESTPLSAMLEARLPLYRAFADCEADNNATPEDTVRRILQALGYLS